MKTHSRTVVFLYRRHRERTYTRTIQITCKTDNETIVHLRDIKKYNECVRVNVRRGGSEVHFTTESSQAS